MISNVQQRQGTNSSQPTPNNHFTTNTSENTHGRDRPQQWHHIINLQLPILLQLVFKLFQIAHPCIISSMISGKASLHHLSKYLGTSSRVLLRADLNVPIREGVIKDPKRIRATVPTIQEILRQGPKSLVILSHMGRPNGEAIPTLSLRPVAQQLERCLGRKVHFLDSCVGEATLNAVKNSNNEIFLCENVRFHAEEVGHKKNADGSKTPIPDHRVQQFRNHLSQLGDCFVNDAFGTAHRAHSSIVGIAHRVRVAGMLMEKELKYLGQFLEKPKRPVLAILGGAKVADKLLLVKNMLKFADEIILGGGMKNPFLTHIFNRKMGDSLNVMPEDPQVLVDIINEAQRLKKKLHFPMDYRVATTPEMRHPRHVKIMTAEEDIQPGQQVFDIGPGAGRQYDEIIQRAGSIFWNGPVGVIETPEFRKGSEDILHSMIRATRQGATTIIGGGDSASLVTKLQVEHELSFVSTGGGATIELFEGKSMPGVACLSEVGELEDAFRERDRIY